MKVLGASSAVALAVAATLHRHTSSKCLRGQIVLKFREGQWGMKTQ